MICSARGCNAAAQWGLRWNNPKIHPPEREKIWMACEEHCQWLADYLDDIRRTGGDPLEGSRQLIYLARASDQLGGSLLS